MNDPGAGIGPEAALPGGYERGVFDYFTGGRDGANMLQDLTGYGKLRMIGHKVINADTAVKNKG